MSPQAKGQGEFFVLPLLAIIITIATITPLHIRPHVLSLTALSRLRSITLSTKKSNDSVLLLGFYIIKHLTTKAELFSS